MTTYWPTLGCLRVLEGRGIAWPEVAVDLTDHVQTTSPCPGYDTRVRVCAEKYQAYCEPQIRDGEDGFLVVGVRRRVRAAPPEQPVVGVEAPLRIRRTHGGQGSRWPTTWRELYERVEQHPAARLEQSSKHLILFLGDARVAALPAHANDHRALLNTCQTLRSLGVDVRR